MTQHLSRRFLRAEAGSVTIEFLLGLPMLLWAILAGWVYYDAYHTRAINIRTGYTLGDALSRETNFISPNYMNSLQQLQEFLLQTGDDPQLRVTVVRYDAATDVHAVVWSAGRGGPVALDDSSIVGYSGVIPVMPNQGRMILFESWVDYKPDFQVGLNDFTFHTVTATRPRFAGQLCWNDQETGSLATSTC